MASHELTYRDVQHILTLLDGWRTGRAEMTIGDLHIVAELAEPGGAKAQDSVAVAAPAVGIFKPAETLAIGAPVEADTVVGIVEMAGVSVPVAAGARGRIKRICAQAGTFVEYGAHLIELASGETRHGEGHDLHRRRG